MSASSEDEIVQEPSMAINSSPSRVPKNGAQLQTTWRSAKNASEPPKPPSHRHMTASNIQIFRVRTARGVRSPLFTLKLKKFVQKPPWTVAMHIGKWLP